MYQLLSFPHSIGLYGGTCALKKGHAGREQGSLIEFKSAIFVQKFFRSPLISTKKQKLLCGSENPQPGEFDE